MSTMMSETEIDKIVELYKAGSSAKKIAEKTSRSGFAIYSALARRGVPRRRDSSINGGASSVKRKPAVAVEREALVSASATIEEVMEVASRLRHAYCKIVIDLKTMQYRARRISKNETGSLR